MKASLHKKDISQWFQELLLDGQIDGVAYAYGRREFGLRASGQDWMTFITRLFLLLGGLLCVAALIFFFAWNWDSFSRFSKFVLAQSVFVVFVLGILWADRPIGKHVKAENNTGARLSQALWPALGLSVGSMFALYGQTFQTGANSWELFRAWCLCLIPMAMIARSNALVLLVYITALLWTFFYNSDFWSFGSKYVFLDRSMMSVSLLFWLLFEAISCVQTRFRVRAQLADWLTALAGGITLALLTARMCLYIFYTVFERGMSDGYTYPILGVLPWPVLYLALCAMSLFWYLRVRPHAFLPSLFVLSAGILIAVGIITSLFTSVRDSNLIFLFVVSGACIIGLCFAAGKMCMILRKIVLRKRALIDKAAEEKTVAFETDQHVATYKDQPEYIQKEQRLPESMVTDDSTAESKNIQTELESEHDEDIHESGVSGNAYFQPLSTWERLALWVSKHTNTSREQTIAILEQRYAESHDAQPWYVKIFITLGLWIGAAFLAGCIFLLLERSDRETYCLLAVLLYGVGLWLLRGKTFAIRQCGLCLTAMGIYFAAWAFSRSDEVLALVIGVICLGFWLRFKHESSRGLAFACALYAFFVWAAYNRWESMISDAPHVILSAGGFFYSFALALGLVVSALYTIQPLRLGIGNMTKVFLPLLRSAFAGCMVFAAAFLLMFSVAEAMIFFDGPRGNQDFNIQAFTSFYTAFAFALSCVGFIAVAMFTKKTSDHEHTTNYFVFAAIVLAFAVLAWFMLVVAMGLMLLLLTRLAFRPVYYGFATLYIGWGLFFYYYALSETLLEKSKSLALAGITLLLFSLIVHALQTYRRRKHSTQQNAVRNWSRRHMVSWPVSALFCACILTGYNFAINGKEDLLQNGQRIITAIQPVDPRSLMQGDYMILDLQVESELSRALQKRETENNNLTRTWWQALLGLGSSSTQNWALLQKKDQQWGFESLLPEGKDCSSSEAISAQAQGSVCMMYRENSEKVRVGSGSYFIEEGTGRDYDNAKFVVLVVGKDGTVLVADLLSSDYERIQPKK